MLVGRKKGKALQSVVLVVSCGFHIASLIRQHSLIAIIAEKLSNHGDHGCRRKRELNTWLPGHDETVEPLLSKMTRAG